MISGIVGNLLADLVWAPVVWLAMRAWRRHRQMLAEAHKRTHELLQGLHERLDALNAPDDGSMDWEDV